MVLSLIVAVTGQTSVSLRFQPPLGQTLRYQIGIQTVQSMTGGMQMPATTMRHEMQQTMRIASRKGDRTTIEAVIDKVKVTIPPSSPLAGMRETMEKAAAGKTTMVIDARGNLVSSKVGGPASQRRTGLGPGAMQSLMGVGLQGIGLPTHPVRVGQSWSGSVDYGKMMKASGASAGGFRVEGVIPTRTTLAGIRKVGGRTLARLTRSMKGTMKMSGGGTSMTTALTGKGETWIEVGTGVVWESSTVHETTTQFGGGTLRQKATISMRKV